MQALDLAQLGGGLDEILDCVERAAHFGLGEDALLGLNAGEMDPALLSRLLRRAKATSNAHVGITGVHAGELLHTVAQTAAGTQATRRLRLLARLTRTQTGALLPLGVHASVPPQGEVALRRVDCTALFAAGYVLPHGEFTAQEPVLGLLRLLGGIQFEGASPAVTPASHVVLSIASALLGVEDELEKHLLHSAATVQQAERNRNRLMALLFAGWINQAVCAASSLSATDVQVWTSPSAGNIVSSVLQSKVASMKLQGLDGEALLQLPQPLPQPHLPVETDLDARFAERIKPELAQVLLAGVAQSKLPPLVLELPLQTQFWIRSGRVHENNPLQLVSELQSCGALPTVKLYQTLPVCECDLKELMSIAQLVQGGSHQDEDRDVCAKVLEAFQVDQFHVGASKVFFRNRNGLYGWIWGMRTGEERGELAPALMERLSALFSPVCVSSPPKRERLSHDGENHPALDSTRRRTARRMSKKLELVKPQRRKLSLAALAHTIVLVQRLVKAERQVLIRSQVRAVGAHNHQTHCALVKSGHGLTLLSFASRADSFLAPSAAVGCWPGVVDYLRLSDVCIELQFAAATAPLVVQFDSEACNHKWSFAIEQSLALPRQEGKRPAAPAAPGGSSGLARRPSISRNLLGDVVNELVQTETKYIADLDSVLVWFRDPMARQMAVFQLEQHELDAIFINLAQIKVFHESLLGCLPAPAPGVGPMQTCEAFARAFRERQVFFSKIYTVYTDRHSGALATFAACVKRSKKLAKFMQQTATEHQQQDLASFLIKPIQRMVKYPLFFKQLVDWVKREDDAMVPAGLRAKEMEDTLEVAKRITQQVTVHDASRELRGVEIMLQCAFEDMPQGLVLCEPGRSFVDEFKCKLVSTATAAEPAVKAKKSSKHWHLLVFNDVVMFAKPDSIKANTFKYRGWFELQDLAFSMPHTNSTLDIVFTPPVEEEDEGEDENDNDNRSQGGASVSSFKSASSSISSKYSSMKKSLMRRRRRSSTKPQTSSAAAGPTQRFTLAFDREEARNQAFAVLNRAFEAHRSLATASAALGRKPS